MCRVLYLFTCVVQVRIYIIPFTSSVQKRALEAYRLDPEKWGVNVQSLSGSPANFQVRSVYSMSCDGIMNIYFCGHTLWQVCNEVRISNLTVRRYKEGCCVTQISPNNFNVVSRCRYFFHSVLLSPFWHYFLSFDLFRLLAEPFRR